MSRRRVLCCGACFEARRGPFRTFEELDDLSRHAKQKHPSLPYVPVKWLTA